jgi:hypothetical protein
MRHDGFDAIAISERGRFRAISESHSIGFGRFGSQGQELKGLREIFQVLPPLAIEASREPKTIQTATPVTA